MTFAEILEDTDLGWCKRPPFWIAVLVYLRPRVFR